MIGAEKSLPNLPSKGRLSAGSTLGTDEEEIARRKRGVNTLNRGKEFLPGGTLAPGSQNALAEPLAQIPVAAAFRGLFSPYRYKIFYGGRGGAKSTTFADVLGVFGAQNPMRILCAREFQTSIKDSVIALLKARITKHRLKHFYKFGQTYIEGKNGTEFIFKGLRLNPDDIKGLEGIDIAWIEEAQRVSEASWTYLIPTIRKEGSEIWASFNPELADDPTYKRFVTNTPPNTLLVKVNWNDNPWFPGTLNDERLYLQSVDLDAYDWIWEGNPRTMSEAVIFKGKFTVERFETPKDAKRMQGADWGLSDPTVLVSCFEMDGCLFVDHECYARNLDLDRIAPTWRGAVPDCDKWPIEADSAQPQTINHVRGFGFRIGPAKKWNGSVEDGIRFLRKYKKIIVHERCYYTAQEMRLYSYKTDRLTGEVLPIIVDKHNHCIDALRYAVGKRIRKKGGAF